MATNGLRHPPHFMWLPESSPLVGEIIRLIGHARGHLNRSLTWPFNLNHSPTSGEDSGARSSRRLTWPVYLKLSPGKRGGSVRITERNRDGDEVRNQPKTRQIEHARPDPIYPSVELFFAANQAERSPCALRSQHFRVFVAINAPAESTAARPVPQNPSGHPHSPSPTMIAP
jgi:hypothetical protein